MRNILCRLFGHKEKIGKIIWMEMANKIMNQAGLYGSVETQFYCERCLEILK